MEILSENIHPLLGVLIVIFGMFIYYCFDAISTKGFYIGDWWHVNQIRFTMICMVLALIFWLSHEYHQITFEHCFYLGVTGTMFLDKFLKRKV